MTDQMHEDVTQAIFGLESPTIVDHLDNQDEAKWEDLPEDEWLDQGFEIWLPPKRHYREQADAAITAATPHIERALLERLIAEAESLPDWPESPFSWECSPFVGEMNDKVADWLRSKLETAP